jgi:glyoxylase-like metal-dependent hydrolase (beta-lactamase superfamily II)
MSDQILNIPTSTATVSVSVINTTASIKGIDTWKFFEPPIKGHEWLAAPCYSFLIEHKDASGKIRRLVFDLGIRKDWQNLSPFLLKRFETNGYAVDVKQSVREILESNNISCDRDQIEALIWSHWHFDHTGNPSEFPASTKLIVGPGFKEKLLPGYPTNAESAILESDYTGRTLEEVEFSQSGLRVGQFAAVDYFGDGSFFLLDSPGHAVGHICGLARVTSEPASFVFMGGDIAHHAGEWRPSPHLPLPEQIKPHPFHDEPQANMPFCPGSLFEDLGQSRSSGGSRTETFYKPAKLETGQIHHDIDQTIASIEKMQELDGIKDESIIMCVAHDETLLGVIDFFPKTINDFAKKDWVGKLRWRFLRDFAGAVDHEIPGKQSWAPIAKS